MKWTKRRIPLSIVIIIAFLLGFEAYTYAVVHFERKAGMPQNLGNFERIRNSLKKQEPVERFSFAVIGDVRGLASFERICDELRDESLSFMAITGGFVNSCTKGNHDYFQWTFSKRCRLRCPVLLIAGDHDIDYKEMDYDDTKVQLVNFERMYGPANFYFEYSDCLFVGLCTLPPPFSNRQSIDFLEATLSGHKKQYRKVFVFTHMPVVTSDGPVAASFGNAGNFLDVVDRYHVDYVISSQYHDYEKTIRKDTVFLTIGGGGSPLDNKEKFNGSRHAVVLTVDGELVSEKIVLAPHSVEITNIPKYFAITKLFPILSRHVSFTIAENLVIIIIFCVFLWNMVVHRKVVQL